MTEQLRNKLSDSKTLRWSVLALVAFTMLCGYFLTDVMSPLKPMLEKELLWDSLDYGFFTSAYGWFNVFLLMLIFGGIILDKMGVRFTGMGACILMVLGCGLKYYAISTTFPEGALIMGFKTQVFLAALGYAIFGVGVEIAGITVSKIIVKWFKGKEMALAMGLEWQPRVSVLLWQWYLLFLLPIILAIRMKVAVSIPIFRCLFCCV